MKDLRMISLQW